MISEAEQDYLKAIYKLQKGRNPVQSVSTNMLAEELQVAAASVTNMMKNLAEMKLIQYIPYQGVQLTCEGEKIALEVIRHHRLIELYLAQALGVPWDRVHQEAEKWEHVVSRDIAEKMEAFLGFPTADPHGQPIPNSSGTIFQPPSASLADLQPGQSAVIVEVNDRNPDLLRYLAGLGLVPQIQITLKNKEPFNGPITIQVGPTTCSVGVEVAHHIYVADIDAPSVEKPRKETAE